MNLMLRCNLIFLLVNLLLFNYSYAAKHQSDSKDDFNEFNEFDQSNEVDKLSEEIQLTEDDFVYLTPDIEQEKYYLFEHFDDERQYTERWIKSLASKSDSKENKYDGEWSYVSAHPKLKGDNAIMMNSKAKHHAISSRLLKKFEFKREPLVVQYEVQFRNGQECGGAYIKLLTTPVKDLYKVNDETPYTIMFGPDKCGGVGKLHFIFKHKNPINGTVREIHFNKANALSNKLSDVFKDGKWHVFRLIIRPDNSFEIQVDKKVLAKGSLLEDFEPPVNPPKEIEDPSEKKPEDYDDREKIPDPDDRKPEGWDEAEPRKIADPKAKKPDDWNDNTEWKPPLIDNPKFKGKWKPRLIPNPDYKGPWKAKIIKNPNYYNDQFPFKMASIDSVAFELWSISDGIAFDNVLITDSVDVANYILDHTQLKKDLLDSETDNLFIKLIKETNKKPYLWLIYFAVIAIPVILFIGYCCVTPGRKSQDQTAKNKKKDDNSEQILDEEEIDEQPSTSSGARLRKTKRVD